MPDTRPEYTSIAELAARSGTVVPCAGNLPVELDDPDSVWFVDRGAVNLFLVEFRDGVERTAPQHLLRREAGWLLPGVAPDERDGDEHTTLSLVAKGLPGTLLRRLPASMLSEVHPAEQAEQVDTWLTAITETISRLASHTPRPTALAEPGLTQTVAPGTLSARRGVVWVSEPPRGESLFMGILEQGEFAGARSPHDARDTADADELAHPVRGSDHFGLVDRNVGAAGEAAAGACLVSRGRSRPGAPQSPTRDG